MKHNWKSPYFELTKIFLTRLGPEVIDKYINVTKANSRLAIADGIELKTEEKKLQLRCNNYKHNNTYKISQKSTHKQQLTLLHNIITINDKDNNEDRTN